MTIPGNRPFFCGARQRAITVRGGECFFVPGINGVKCRAAAAASGAA